MNSKLTGKGAAKREVLSKKNIDVTKKCLKVRQKLGTRENLKKFENFKI